MADAVFLTWVIGSALLLVWCAFAIRRERRRRLGAEERARKLAVQLVYDFNDGKVQRYTQVGELPAPRRCSCLDHIPEDRRGMPMGMICTCGANRMMC